MTSVRGAVVLGVLLTVSEVIIAYPQIQELDLNPIIIQEHGLNIADARIILKNP